MFLFFQKVLHQIWTYWLRPIWNIWAVCGYGAAAIKPLSNVHSPCRMLNIQLKGAHASRACNETMLLKLGVRVHGLFVSTCSSRMLRARSGNAFFFPHTCKVKVLPWIKVIFWGLQMLLSQLSALSSIHPTCWRTWELPSTQPRRYGEKLW